MNTRRTAAIIAALVVAWYSALGAGSGLNNRTNRIVLFLYSQYGALVDTVGTAKVRSYSTQYADTTGNGLKWTATASLDGSACWYRDNWETDIVDVYWDSAGTLTLMHENYMIPGRTLGDSMVTDSLVLGPSVVRSASIVNGAVTTAKIDSAAVTGAKHAAASVYPVHLVPTDSVYVVTCVDVDSLKADTLIISAGGLDTLGLNTDNWEDYIQSHQSATGAAQYTDSIRLGVTVYDADRWFTSGLVDTAAVDTAQWGGFVRDHQAGGSAGMPAADFADSLASQGFVNADTTGGPLATYAYISGLAHMAAADFPDSFWAEADSGIVLATMTDLSDYLLLSAAGDSVDAGLADYLPLADVRDSVFAAADSDAVFLTISDAAAAYLLLSAAADTVAASAVLLGDVRDSVFAAADSDVVFLTISDAADAYQPLESTLTDIADGTISEDLVNTSHPWADNEVADDITASNYLLLSAAGDSVDANTADLLALADVRDSVWAAADTGVTVATMTNLAAYLPLADVGDSVEANAYYPGGTDVADADVVDALTLSTVSGAVDMGSATSLEIPNGANPTTDAAGEIAWDSDDYAIEVYHEGESESALIPVYCTIDALIFQPDQVNDQVVLKHVDALVYPHGIEIDQLSITLPADAAYSMVFEEWAGDPPVAQNDIATVTTGSGDAYMEDGTPTDGTLDADDYIVLDIPATDVDWVHVQVIYHVTEGD